MERTSLLVIGLVIGVAALAVSIISVTENQNTIDRTTPLQSSAEEGPIRASDSPFSPTINKEQWREDPFAERAAEIKEKFYSGT